MASSTSASKGPSEQAVCAGPLDAGAVAARHCSSLHASMGVRLEPQPLRTGDAPRDTGTRHLGHLGVLCRALRRQERLQTGSNMHQLSRGEVAHSTSNSGAASASHSGHGDWANQSHSFTASLASNSPAVCLRTRPGTHQKEWPHTVVTGLTLRTRARVQLA